MAMNSTVSAATGKAPNELVFGVNVSLPCDHALAHVVPNVSAEELASRITRGVQSARAQLARAADYMSQYANRRRRDVQFGVGERVLLSTRHLRTVGSQKFKQRFVGPFDIVSRVGE